MTDEELEEAHRRLWSYRSGLAELSPEEREKVFAYRGDEVAGSMAKMEEVDRLRGLIRQHVEAWRAYFAVSKPEGLWPTFKALADEWDRE